MYVKFIGYGSDIPYFGDGVFIEGNTYFVKEADDSEYLVIDEDNDSMWERRKYFVEVVSE